MSEYNDRKLADQWREFPESWKGAAFEKVLDDVRRKDRRRKWGLPEGKPGCNDEGKLCDEGLRLLMEIVGAYARKEDITATVDRYLEHITLERTVRRLR